MKKRLLFAVLAMSAGLFCSAQSTGSDTLALFDFNNPATAVATGTADDHEQTCHSGTWHRIPGSAYLSSSQFLSDYPTTGEGYGSFTTRMTQYLDSSFMLMSMEDTSAYYTQFNAWFELGPIDVSTVELVTVKFQQVYAKYYDTCFIDYTDAAGEWHTMEVNVTGVDVNINYHGDINMSYTLPLNAAHNSALKLRFRWKSTQRINWAGYVWAIDNVAVCRGKLSSLDQYADHYVEGAYGQIPQGLHLPLSWWTQVKNSGATTQTGISASLLQLDASKTQTGVIATATYDNIEPSPQLVTLNIEGQDNIAVNNGSHSYSNYYGQTGTSDNNAGLGSDTPGHHFVTARVATDSLTLAYDTLLYNVTTPDGDGIYTWAYDNGLLLGGRAYRSGYMYDNGWYITSTDGAYNRAGYTVLNRYSTGSQIPVDDNGQPWVIRGIEVVPAITMKSNQYPGAILVAMLTEEFHEQQGYMQTMNKATGAAPYTVQTSDLNTQYGIYENGYNTIRLMFNEQVALEPNKCYYAGYKLENDHEFAAATTGNSYSTDGTTSMALADDPQLADYAKIFANTTYSTYLYDPVYNSWRLCNDNAALVRLLVGPRTPAVATHTVTINLGDGNVSGSWWGSGEGIGYPNNTFSVSNGASHSLFFSMGANTVLDSVIVTGTSRYRLLTEGYGYRLWLDSITTDITIAVVSSPMNCDTTYTLPYESNFLQCWEAVGETANLDLYNASIQYDGDTVYSPWFTAESGIPVFASIGLSCYSNSNASARLDIQGEDGSIYESYNIIRGQYYATYMNEFYELPAINGRFRFRLSWDYHDDNYAFNINSLILFQYNIQATVSGPDTLQLGQSATYTFDITLPNGDTVNEYYWWSNGNGLDVISAGNTATVTATDPGTHHLFAEIDFRNSEGYYVDKTIDKLIIVPDTIDYACPDVVEQAPYATDFTQCWTLIGGAELLPDGRVKLSAPGQKAVGPWVSIPDQGTLRMPCTFERDGVNYYDDNDIVYINCSLRDISGERINSNTRYVRPSINNFGDGNSEYSVYNGRTLRWEFEYSGGNDTVYLTNADIFHYDLTADVNVPAQVYAGEPTAVTAVCHITGDDQPSEYYWYCYGENYSGNVNYTIINGDGTANPSIIWEEPGTYQLVLRLTKANAFNGQHQVREWIYQTVTVVENPNPVAVDCDTVVYEMPYTSYFPQCWETGGNATIVNSHEARLHADGDTLHSPWIHITSNTAKLAFSYTSDRVPIDNWSYSYKPVRYNINIVDSASGTTQNYSTQYNSYGGGDFMKDLEGLAGHTIRVDFLFNTLDTSDFILTKMAVFEVDPLPEIEINGPDTVAMGQSVTYTASVPEGISPYWYSTNNSGSSGSTYNVSWDNAGIKYVTLSLSRTVFGGYYVSDYVDKEVIVVPSDSILAQTVLLPYSANFAEGWELSGGATLTNDGRIKLDSMGQRAISPWIYIGPKGQMHWQYELQREEGASSTLHYKNELTDYSGNRLSWSDDNYITGSSFYMPRYNEGTYHNGKIVRFAIEYNELDSDEPIYLSSFDMFQLLCDITIEGPDTVYVGHEVKYKVNSGVMHHASQPEPESEPTGEYAPSFTWQNGNGHISWIYRRADSAMVSWDAVGEYYLRVQKIYPYFYTTIYPEGYSSDYKYIVVIEEPTPEPTPCDTMVYTLPYYADFSQCWMASDGAVIIDSNRVDMNLNHSILTSPLLHCDSNTYLHCTADPSDNVEDSTQWSNCGRLTMKLYDTNGNYIKQVYCNEKLNVPEGNYRITFDFYTQCATVYPVRLHSFWAEDTVIVLPEMVIAPSPDTIYLNDSTQSEIRLSLQPVDSTLTAPHVRDYWYIYKDDQLLSRISCWSDYSMVYPLYAYYYIEHLHISYVGTYTIIVRDADSVEIDRRTIVVLSDSDNPIHCHINEFPYVQDFENGMRCWQSDTISGNGLNPIISGGLYIYTSYYNYQSFGPYQGSGFLRLGRSSSTNDNGRFLSPDIDLGGRVGLLSFNYRTFEFYYNSSSMSEDALYLIYGHDGDTTRRYLKSKSWAEQNMFLPPSTTFIGFELPNANTNSVLIDNIRIDVAGTASNNNDTVVVIDTIVRDTVIYNTSYRDTTEYNITTIDTTVYNINTIDSTVYNINTVDSTTYNITIVDSTVYNITTLDSVVINIVQSDSVIYFYDTTCATHDTLLVTELQHDTIRITEQLFDTIWLHDTIWLTEYIHDTVIIHDTIYRDPEGIGDVEVLNAKVYSSNGQIVVEGAEGNIVRLFDVNGRTLATKRDDYAPLRFDVHASGTYMIKIGNHSAKKIVVIR